MSNSSGFGFIGLVLGAVFAAVAVNTVVNVAEGINFGGDGLFEKKKGNSGLF